jgi:uncharacterized repeat protein (TIGR01451 family)
MLLALVAKWFAPHGVRPRKRPTAGRPTRRSLWRVPLLERLQDRITPAPMILSTSVSTRTVSIVFSEALDPSTVNKSNIFVIRQDGAATWPPTTSNLSSYFNLNDDPRATLTYNSSTDTVTLDYSNLPQTEMQSDSYAIVVLSQNSGGPGVTDTTGNSLDGQFNGSFPSGQNGQPATFIQNLGFEQLVAPQITTFMLSPASNSGTSSNQVANTSQPVLVGQLSAPFPASISGDQLLIQFSGPNNGSTTLAVSEPSGRGYTGTYDKFVTSDSSGAFTVTAPALPDGLQYAVALAIGQADSPPLPGYSSAATDIFSVETPTIGAGASNTLTEITDAGGGPPTGALRESVFDTATVTGVPAGAPPTGTVTYSFTGTAGTSLAGLVAPPGWAAVNATTWMETVALNGGVVPDSVPTAALPAGTYAFQASYSGDGNYTGSASALEPLTVNKASPMLATTPNVSMVTLGDMQPPILQDTATLSGGFNPTGSITFRLYAPGVDPTVGPATYTETVVVSSGDGTYSTAVGFTSNASGTWHWVATYNGDPNNNAAPSGPLDEPVTVSEDADLAVTETVSNATPMVLDTITFTVGLSNLGPATATNVTVSDPLPPGLIFVSDMPSQGSYNPTTGIWTVGTMTTTTPQSLMLTAIVNSAAPQTYTWTISHSDQSDPNLAKNTASVTVTPQLGIVDLAKTVNPGEVLMGTDVTYTFILHNAGPGRAVNVVVSDPFPVGLAFVSAGTASQGSFDPATDVWTVGNVEAGSAATLQVVAQIQVLGPLTNTATVSGVAIDPSLSDPTSSATVTGMRTANMVSKAFFLSLLSNVAGSTTTSASPAATGSAAPTTQSATQALLAPAATGVSGATNAHAASPSTGTGNSVVTAPPVTDTPAPTAPPVASSGGGGDVPTTADQLAPNSEETVADSPFMLTAIPGSTVDLAVTAGPWTALDNLFVVLGEERVLEDVWTTEDMMQRASASMPHEQLPAWGHERGAPPSILAGLGLTSLVLPMPLSPKDSREPRAVSTTTEKRRGACWRG